MLQQLKEHVKHGLAAGTATICQPVRWLSVSDNCSKLGI